MSKHHKNIYEAVFAVQQKVGYLIKDSTAPKNAGGFDYISSAATTVAIRRFMHEEGIVRTLVNSEVLGPRWAGGSGVDIRNTYRYTLVSNPESYIDVPITGSGRTGNSGDKSMFAAHTTSGKYVDLATFYVPVFNDIEAYEDAESLADEMAEEAERDLKRKVKTEPVPEDEKPKKSKGKSKSMDEDPAPTKKKPIIDDDDEDDEEGGEEEDDTPPPAKKRGRPRKEEAEPPAKSKKAAKKPEPEPEEDEEEEEDDEEGLEVDIDYDDPDAVAELAATIIESYEDTEYMTEVYEGVFETTESSDNVLILHNELVTQVNKAYGSKAGKAFNQVMFEIVDNLGEKD